MSTQARIAHAYHTSDLGHHTQACDADTLQAVAMAGIEFPAATHLMRLLLDHDARSYRPAFAAVRGQVDRLAHRFRWKSTFYQCHTLSSTALEDFIAPQCRECTGVGFRRIFGTPHLEAKPCPTCHGSGRHPPHLPAWMRSDTWLPRYGAVTSWLDTIAHEAGRKVARKLR